MRLKMILSISILIATVGCGKSFEASNVAPSAGLTTGSGVAKTFHYYKATSATNASSWTYDATLDFSSPKGFMISVKRVGTADCYYYGTVSQTDAETLTHATEGLRLGFSTGITQASGPLEWFEIETTDGAKTRVHLVNTAVPTGQTYAKSPENSSVSLMIRNYINALISITDLSDPDHYACG
jgi:hypothetical protein